MSKGRFNREKETRLRKRKAVTTIDLAIKDEKNRIEGGRKTVILS